MDSSEISSPASAPDPDKCASRAEAAFQVLSKVGRRQIDSALRIGELMRLAKAQLAHGKFGPSCRRWREEGMITFSERSKNRWMLMAKHADAVKSANLANLREAEQLAQQLESGSESETDQSSTRSPKPSKLNAADTLVEFEHRLLTIFRKLPSEEHRKVLEGALAIIQRRLELHQP